MKKRGLYFILFLLLAVLIISPIMAVDSALAVNITAEPSFIQDGQATRISWSSTNAVRCSATNLSTWTSLTDTSGSQIVNPIQTTTYSIDCYNSEGQVTRANTTVSVRVVNFVSAYNSITVNSPNIEQVSGVINVSADYPNMVLGCNPPDCSFGFFSAYLVSGNTIEYSSGGRLIGQGTHGTLRFSLDTNDFPDGQYTLYFYATNKRNGGLIGVKVIPLIISNPPISIAFKYPAANSVINTPSFFMDVDITRNGQPYIPTLVGYEIKKADQPDTEYISLGLTYPAVNDGDSRGYFACHLFPVQLQPGNYVIRATTTKGSSATLPVTISLTQCPYTDVVRDNTAPVFTVTSPRSGDDSSASSILLEATAYDPGSSFGTNVSSGVGVFWFNIEGFTGGTGLISLNPDSSGKVSYTWRPADGLIHNPDQGIFTSNEKTVYPKPPYTIGVIAHDKAGNTGEWVRIRMSSSQSNQTINITLINPLENQTLPPTNETTPANQTQLCNLTSASWSKTNAFEGETVSLNVQGTNCNGKTVSFRIWERDTFGDDDPVRYDPSNAVFNGNTVSGTAVVEWQSDRFLGLASDPEYYFTATVLGTNEKVNSELLSVVKTPDYVCGDRVCSGIETQNTCPADCSSNDEERNPFYLGGESDSEPSEPASGSGSEFDSNPTFPIPPINQISGPLAIGNWIQLNGNTHVSENPSVSSVVKTTQLTGAKGKIVDGPVEADSYTWFNVDYETGEDGWSKDILMVKIAEQRELT